MRLRPVCPAAPLACALALALIPAPAHAEPTSWFAVGGGYALARNGVTRATDSAFALDTAVGIGTPATHPFVLGGVFRAIGYPGFGADISLSARIAMQSYCVGDFGLALDLGVGARAWGSGAYGTFPLHGVLIAGIPFGFQIAVGVDGGDISGQTQAASGFAALEFDFLRLTSMRSGETTKLWPNPSPANAPPAPASPAP